MTRRLRLVAHFLHIHHWCVHHDALADDAFREFAFLASPRSIPPRVQR